MAVVIVSRKARMTRALAESLVSAAIDQIWCGIEIEQEGLRENLQSDINDYANTLYHEIMEEFFPYFTDALDLCPQAFPESKAIWLWDLGDDSNWRKVKPIELASNKRIPFSLCSPCNNDDHPKMDLTNNATYKAMIADIQALKELESKHEVLLRLIETLRTFPSFKDLEKSELFTQFAEFVDIV